MHDKLCHCFYVRLVNYAFVVLFLSSLVKSTNYCVCELCCTGVFVSCVVPVCL